MVCAYRARRKLSSPIKRLVGALAFLAGIAAVIGLAYAVPEAGTFLERYGGTRAAVIAIFLMSGLTVSLKHLGSDVRRWKCHLLIQGLSFGFIPVAFYFSSGWLPDGALKYGVYLVAAVPTTISTCVVYTTAAGGRTSCALINAVGGNLIGIILSPLLLGLMIGRGGGLDLATAGNAALDLCWLVLLPFVIGHVAGYALPALSKYVRKIQSYAAQGCVLIIVLCTFSKSLSALVGALDEVWRCFAYLGLAHVAFVVLAAACTRLLRFSREESVAAIFCASQKTLGMAIPVALSFFSGSRASLALVVLPIMFFHLFQLIFGSLLIPVLPAWASRCRQ